LALGITPVAAGRVDTAGNSWPVLFEALFTLLAVALLLPRFFILAANIEGRDGRFAIEPIEVAALPAPVLPEVCKTQAALAEPFVADRLCRRAFRVAEPTSVNRMPSALSAASAQVKAAFGAPIARAHARIAELEGERRDGASDLLQSGDAIDGVQAVIRPFVQRYAIDSQHASMPLPLACAYETVAFMLATPNRPAVGEGADTARANAVLLLAAAFDGDTRTAALAQNALLPDASRAKHRQCLTLPLGETLGRAAGLMSDAHHAAQNSAKNDAMRGLLQFAGVQWAVAMLVGWLLLNLSRKANFAGVGVALSLATWAVAAWVARVPFPFATDRAFVAARDAALPLAPPAPFVLALLACAAVVAVASVPLRKTLRTTPQTVATRVGYAGFVVATGVGWLLLLDLSANGNPSNRYLALYHQGHLWLAMVLMTCIAFLRQPLGRAFAWTLSMLDGLAATAARVLGGAGAKLAVVALTLALIATFGALLANLRQVTSELGRLWLMIGASWFFFLRGAPFAERLARNGTSMASLVRYVMPLAFVVLVLIGAMTLTRDMGPLLISGYAAGAFVAASGAMWMHQRYRLTYSAFATALIVFITWIANVTFALFRVGAVDDVTAARLENLAAPLASGNDQLALVTWFQRASPVDGYGLGAVPWCGYGASAGCAGVPAQVQSDYTFTAMVGAFGAPVAWMLTLGCALWLHRLIRHHGRVTRGEPHFVARSGRIVSDEQGFLSWLALTWVVLALCQLAVTVAGNLAVIPLTGVTFPFVSFGMTSLLVNVTMLALAINVNVPRRTDR
jgi:cell division protein FtsW (lipid II flippase)